ncbi:hypothetical protein BGE01nite_31740 [Brevifollis gellanilyticus]|uniref:Uncharacterized protein n=2 Tax=Brevifollis gellanilyticus TaxID=748831 RepID=A0A512MAX4_9BACT|nr:hypothetical protein BGE01nite_31740 [Brevifollis gellanilyticus]
MRDLYVSGNSGNSTLTTHSAGMYLLSAGDRACSPSATVAPWAYPRSFYLWNWLWSIPPTYHFLPVTGERQIKGFTVVEPASETAVKLNDLNYPEGTQGVGMNLEVSLKDKDVSFYNVQMREVVLGPATGVTGIFEKMNPSRLVHQPNPNWVNLTKDNRWTDLAEFHGFPIHEWGPGKFEWNIGVEWRVAGGLSKALPTTRHQVHTMLDNSGSSTITKSFGTQAPLEATRKMPAQFEINSLDRYVEVKVPESLVSEMGGINDFNLRISNSSGEIYDVSLSNATIYQQPSNPSVVEGVFFPSSEAETPWSANQFRNSRAPVAVSKFGSTYKFITCFDRLDVIQVELWRTGSPQDKLARRHTLVAYQHMADLIAMLESTFREAQLWHDVGGYQPVLPFPPPLQQVFASALAGTSVAAPPPPPPPGAAPPPPPPPGQVAASGWGLSFRNLVSKCCSTVYDTVRNGVINGVVIQVEAVKIDVIGAQGFVQGFIAGCKSDYQELTELAEMIAHPVQTAKSLYEGFRGLCSMSMAELKGIPAVMLQQFLGNATKQLSWVDPKGPDGLDLIIYVTGYGAGYLTEQLVKTVVLGVFAVTANIARAAVMGSKIAQTMKALKVLKVGQSIFGALDATKEFAAKISKAKNLIMRTATQWVKQRTGMNKLEAMVKRTLQAGCTN